MAAIIPALQSRQGSLQRKQPLPQINREETTSRGRQLLQILQGGTPETAKAALETIPYPLLAKVKDTELAATLFTLYHKKGESPEVRDAVLAFAREYGGLIGLTVREHTQFKTEQPLTEGIKTSNESIH